MLDRVERDLEHDLGLDDARPPTVLDRPLEEPLRHLGDLRIREPGVRLAYVDEAAGRGVLDRERVVGQHAFALAVAPLDRGHDDVESRQRSLELQPREAASARCVWTLRVLGHQSFMASLAGVGEDAVEVVGAGCLFKTGEEERMLEAQSFEQAATLLERLVQKRATVEVEQVEDHEHNRHLAAEVVRDLLATQPVLELEEAEHSSLSMREDLAVEKHGVSDPRRALRELRKCAGGFLEVA